MEESENKRAPIVSADSVISFVCAIAATAGMALVAHILARFSDGLSFEGVMISAVLTFVIAQSFKEGK